MLENVLEALLESKLHLLLPNRIQMSHTIAHACKYDWCSTIHGNLAFDNDLPSKKFVYSCLEQTCMCGRSIEIRGDRNVCTLSDYLAATTYGNVQCVMQVRGRVKCTCGLLLFVSPPMLTLCSNSPTAKSVDDVIMRSKICKYLEWLQFSFENSVVFVLLFKHVLFDEAFQRLLFLNLSC